MNDKLVRLTLTFPLEREDLLTGLLYLHVAWGWQDEGTLDGQRCLTIHLDRPEQAAELEAVLCNACPELRISAATVDNADWTSAWRQYFTPIAIGSRFVVLPSWMADSPHSAEPILIEPKMAFGTGHHQTTALCLGALDQLAAQDIIRPGQRFLDLGTGSGILAIAAAKLGLTGLALDIDPVAIDNALENADLNTVSDQVSIGVGSVDSIPAATRFDCILANILAHPLMDMAEPLAARLARPGVLVLSGILAEQAERVAAAYMAQGLDAPEITLSGEWVLLVFRR